MSEVIHNQTDEFWRPPVGHFPGLSTPRQQGSCEACGTEFMVGAHFCHMCGVDRARVSRADDAWVRFLRALEFQSVQEWLGLPIASLIAFFAGLGCILAAFLIGIVYPAQNFSDFQAVQLWRMQWLMGAVVAFVAGILLKNSGKQQR